MTSSDNPPRSWTTRREDKARRLQAVAHLTTGKVLDATPPRRSSRNPDRPRRPRRPGRRQPEASRLPVALLRPGRPAKDPRPSPAHRHHQPARASRPVRTRHRPQVDFSFAGPQSLRVAQLLEDGQLEIGSIHTYIELYARMFVDLTPQRRPGLRRAGRPPGQSLHRPEHRGHAGHRRGGRVPARHRHRAGQRDRRTSLPRVDIPGSWVDFIVEADRPSRSSRCSRAIRATSASCKSSWP